MGANETLVVLGCKGAQLSQKTKRAERWQFSPLSCLSHLPYLERRTLFTTEGGSALGYFFPQLEKEQKSGLEGSAEAPVQFRGWADGLQVPSKVSQW